MSVAVITTNPAALQIAYVGFNAGDCGAKDDVTQGNQIRRRKWGTHTEILDVADPAGTKGMRKPPQKMWPVRDMQDRKPAHHSIERAV